MPPMDGAARPNSELLSRLFKAMLINVLDTEPIAMEAATISDPFRRTGDGMGLCRPAAPILLYEGVNK